VILYFLEPVASVKPKFSSLADSMSFKGYQKDNITLLCPAQAFPAPMYR